MARATYRDIEIQGVVYADAAAAAAAFGVTAGWVRLALRTGCLDRIGTGPVERQVTIRGVTYPNFSEAGKALGVDAGTVRAAYRKGTLDRVGTGRVGPEPMRVRIAGMDFRDVKAAAAHFGVVEATVYSAICDGDPDRIARPATYNPWKSQPFSIGGLSFPSKRAASRALGFKNEEYIAKVLKSGSRRGRERILAAAMAYAARGDHAGGAA